MAAYNAVTPTYFSTVGMPLLIGRSFTPSDSSSTTRDAIVSRSFAARFWPDTSALGHHVGIPARDPALAHSPFTDATIVGIVNDTDTEALDLPRLPQIYVPYAQDPSLFATLAIRTVGDPFSLTKDVQRSVWLIDKDQPTWKIRTLRSLVDRSFSNRRYTAFFLVCFAAIALALAMIGLYAVLAYMVSQRTVEFGVRLAVGATAPDILKLVVRKGLLLTGTGLLCGILAAKAAAPIVQWQMYQVRTTDPAIYAFVSLLLLSVALIAVLLPAQRAVRLDPMTALRHE